jgi:hypothetical protein
VLIHARVRSLVIKEISNHTTFPNYPKALLKSPAFSIDKNKRRNRWKIRWFNGLT